MAVLWERKECRRRQKREFYLVFFPTASQVLLMVKNPPANEGDARDEVSIPGSGRSPGGGHGSPLRYSCLNNSMDRGAWQGSMGHMGPQRANMTEHAHVMP